MSFFEELKRRNVVRVGIAYGVASWVLLQIADLVLDNVEAPDWVMDVFLLIVVLGFLVSVVIAWAYEITPEGIKKEADVDRSQSIAGHTGKKLDRVIILFLVLAVSVLLFERSMTPEPEAVITETPQVEVEEVAGQVSSIEPSIAVLPFVNMSNDPDQEYFSDGISEELLNLLVRVNGLKVASRTSSFIYKGENLNIPAIAAELKVNHILEGSVRKADNRVRITAQLIDTTDDRHLWSDTFDRELVDIFAIQDEIANAIVDALKSELGVGLEAVSVATATESLDAYDLYLKGRGLFIARQDLAFAAELLNRATDLDPEFARAWELLAGIQSVSTSWLTGDGVDHDSLAIAAALRALEVDPGLSLAHAVIGMKRTSENDFLAGMENLDTAVRNDPKNSTAWLWRGITLKSIGFMEASIKDFEECLAIDPDYQNCRQHMAVAYLINGDIRQAEEHFEAVLRENFHSTDDEFVAHYVNTGRSLTAYLLGASSVFGEYAPIKDWIYAIENPDADHRSALASWRRWAATQNIDECNLGALVVTFKLDHCYAPETVGGLQLIWREDAAYYRSTEGFKQLINRNLMPYWQKYGFPPQCQDLGDGDFTCD
jgi:TolB-like protein